MGELNYHLRQVACLMQVVPKTGFYCTWLSVCSCMSFTFRQGDFACDGYIFGLFKLDILQETKSELAIVKKRYEETCSQLANVTRNLTDTVSS